MVRRILLIGFMLFAIQGNINPDKANAQYNSATNHIFYGVGPLFENPGSVRLGLGSWEVGMLTTAAYGINKIFQAGQYTYFAFGPVVVPVGEVGVGMYGAVGLKGKLFWRFGYRIELNSVVASTGFSRGQGLLGLSFYF